jgi:hypothetical protein
VNLGTENHRIEALSGTDGRRDYSYAARSAIRILGVSLWERHTPLDLSLPTRTVARDRLRGCDSRKAEHGDRPPCRQIMEPPESSWSDGRDQITDRLRHR